MRSLPLLPVICKWIGLVLLLPSIYLATHDIQMFATTNTGRNFTNNNLSDEIGLTGVFIGLLFLAFSRLKNEDEYTNHLRLTSLQWAVIINYTLLIIFTWVLYGTAFLAVPLYNMLTVLLIFIVRFYGLVIIKSFKRN